VFHWLTQTEIDRQRYRSQQLGSAQALARLVRRPGGMHDLILQLITTNSARTDASLPVTLLLSSDDFEADASRAGTAVGSSFPHGYHQHRTSDRFGEPG
jgi:hypothetical protein